MREKIEKWRKINVNEREKTKEKKVSLVELNNNKQKQDKFAKRREERNNIDME